MSLLAALLRDARQRRVPPVILALLMLQAVLRLIAAEGRLHTARQLTLQAFADLGRRACRPPRQQRCELMGIGGRKL